VESAISVALTLSSPTAKSPTSIFEKVFFPVAPPFAIKVTSDLLTNLYELTTWLIPSMRRNQPEMHLQKHCTGRRWDAADLRNFLCASGFQQISRQKCVAFPRTLIPGIASPECEQRVAFIFCLGQSAPELEPWVCS
jgi:hypothetical protein